jgi:hypothetical protein
LPKIYLSLFSDENQMKLVAGMGTRIGKIMIIPALTTFLD